MTSTKYIGLDVHKESISIAVLNSAGKVVMEMRHRDQSEHPSAVLSTGWVEMCTSRLKKALGLAGCTIC